MVIPSQKGINQKLLVSIEITLWIGIFGIPLAASLLPLSKEDFNILAVVAGIAAISILILFHWLIPRYGIEQWISYLGGSLTIGFIAAYSFILKPYGVHIDILYIAVITSVGTLAGGRAAIHAASLSAVAETMTVVFQPEFSASLFANLSIQILVIIITGYLISYLTGAIHRQIKISERQNRYLSSLLQIGIIATKPDQLQSILSKITERVSRDLPVTFCRIHLLNPNQADYTTYAAYPLRQLDGWEFGIGKHIPAAMLPEFQKALDTYEYQILKDNELDSLTRRFKGKGPYFGDVNTICIIPLIAKGEKFGVITAGETRQWEREPFTQEKIDLLQTLATQIAATIHNVNLYQKAQHQAQRLAVVNEVAKAIGSTIEMDDLLELIYEQLSKVIQTDTYFVALYDDFKNALNFRILIDDNVRFPPEKTPVKKGLASWVIENRQPLLLRHLSKEIESLPSPPILLGQDRMSESWLGVPLIVGDLILGLLAIASYSTNAFGEDDVQLLSNVASQAALALENARQHEDVKEQARRDSLTGAYNHRYLLLLLKEALETAQDTQTPLSMIMVDADYFKEYNDQYGHVIGDELLCQLVIAIQSELTQTDFLGRWGGEEFTIVLPGKDLQQTIELAQKIRELLRNIRLFDNNSLPIPNPTVSQGIVSYSSGGESMDLMIEKADQALYHAKQKGRDLIIVASKGKFLSIQS